jgi:hypothetical protein
MDNWTLLALPEESPREATRTPAPVVPGSYGPDMEMATTAFRAQQYGEARRHVRSVLRAQPSDGFANDFMATLFYLDNNLDASFKYWNRVDRPVVRDIRVDPLLKLDPVLLERNFAFSRASILEAAEFRETTQRLDSTGVFARYQLELEPAGGGQFDVVLRAAEKGGIGLSWLRGLPYETVHPEFFNLGGRAINFRSLLRWDAQRRRVWVALSGPLQRSPNRTWSFEWDARDEEWSSGPSMTPVRKAELKAQLRSIVDRWTWTGGAAVAKSGSYRLKYFASVERTVLDLPESRFRSVAVASVEAGRVFGKSARFGKVAGALQTRWLPNAADDAYELRSVIRAGKSAGTVPFDELFAVGMDRDQGVWMRAHKAIRHQAYAISNLDLQRRIYQGTFWGLSAGPFLDTGIVSHKAPVQWDAGLQLRLNLLGGFQFDISYGRDLRSGNNLAFANSFR